MKKQTKQTKSEPIPTAVVNILEAIRTAFLPCCSQGALDETIRYVKEGGRAMVINIEVYENEEGGGAVADLRVKDENGRELGCVDFHPKSD